MEAAKDALATRLAQALADPRGPLSGLTGAPGHERDCDSVLLLDRWGNVSGTIDVGHLAADVVAWINGGGHDRVTPPTPHRDRVGDARRARERKNR